MERFEQEIIAKAELIGKVLESNNDVLIKTTKDGSLKIMYYEPKNLKNKI